MYFSGKDAQLFIEDTYIHEAVTFEFSDSQQKMPIYGYKPVVWDDVLIGDIIVQGGFMLNRNQPENFADRIDIVDSLAKFDGSDDTAFLPPIAGEAPISRNKVKIQLIYSSKQFKDTMDRLGQVLTTGNNQQFNWIQDKLYGYDEELRIITIEDAVITAHTESVQIDSNPAGIFYSFIARRAF